MEIWPISCPLNKHIGYYIWMTTIYLCRVEHLLSYAVMAVYRVFFYKKIIILNRNLEQHFLK